MVSEVGRALLQCSRAAAARPDAYRDACAGTRCAERRDLYDRAATRARGDERLSAKKRSESDRSGRSKHSNGPPSSDKKPRKQRSSDLGRALRSIYDDTLRESVPDDFVNLIGKLR